MPPKGALKDYSAEASRDLMPLLPQLEEGYNLVPSEDGMGLTVDPKGRMPTSSRSRSSSGRKSAPSSSATKSTKPLAPTRRLF